MSTLSDLKDWLKRLEDLFRTEAQSATDPAKKTELTGHADCATELKQEADAIISDLNARKGVFDRASRKIEMLVGRKAAPARMSRDDLWKLYSEVADYDLHYSTARIAINTFLGGLGVTVGSYGVIRESEPFAIVIAGLLFLFALVFNAQFYVMTRCCWELQKAIEKNIYRDPSVTGVGGVRSWLKATVEFWPQTPAGWFYGGVTIVGLLLWPLWPLIFFRPEFSLDFSLTNITTVYSIYSIILGAIVYFGGLSVARIANTTSATPAEDGLRPKKRISFFDGKPDFHFTAAFIGFAVILIFLTAYCEKIDSTTCGCRLGANCEQPADNDETPPIPQPTELTEAITDLTTSVKELRTVLDDQKNKVGPFDVNVLGEISVTQLDEIARKLNAIAEKIGEPVYVSVDFPDEIGVRSLNDLGAALQDDLSEIADRLTTIRNAIDNIEPVDLSKLATQIRNLQVDICSIANYVRVLKNATMRVPSVVDRLPSELWEQNQIGTKKLIALPGLKSESAAIEDCV